MINIHLNGDIIRCPDIKKILERDREQKKIHRICKYNIHEDNCSTWQNSLMNWQNVKKNNCAGSCMLSVSMVCPGRLHQVEIGNKQKTFKIDNTIYRKIASTAHYLVKESKNKVLFITLTIPKIKKNISDEQLNKCFSKFVENLRQNYSCGGYIAVRERGNKFNRIHYHLLLSIPFVSFVTLNSAWNAAISDFCVFSKNALTTDPKTKFVKNPIRAMKYVCKYFSKSKGKQSDSRLVFISNNIIQKPKAIRGENYIDLLKGYKGIEIKQTSDYTTQFRITDKNDFQRFCDNFLYPLFELSSKKSEFLYAFPIDSS